MGPKKADRLLEPLRGKSEKEYFWAVYGAYKHHYGTESFNYFRFDAYEDTTATFRKRELKPNSEILSEQRLVGSALIFLLENARLLWMLRCMPNAEGTHWWMPPMTFDEIVIDDDVEKWAAKEAALPVIKAPKGTKPFMAFTEGRGKWFFANEDNIKSEKYSTAKKAKAAIAEVKLKLDIETNEDNENLQPVNSEVESILDTSEPAAKKDVVDASIDRVYYNFYGDGMWGFWCKRFVDTYGPYNTEEEARLGLASQIARLASEADQGTTDETDKAAAVDKITQESTPKVVTNNKSVTKVVDTNTDDVTLQKGVSKGIDFSDPIWDESF